MSNLKLRLMHLTGIIRFGWGMVKMKTRIFIRKRFKI